MNFPTNLSISVSDADIAAISTLSNDAYADLATRINCTDPQLIFDFVEGKEGKQIICPLCGSGSGKCHTGASITLENGVWLYHCWANNDCNGDLISIIAAINNLSTKGKDFFQVLAIASKILGISISAGEHTIKKISNSMESKHTPPIEFKQLDDAKKFYKLLSKTTTVNGVVYLLRLYNFCIAVFFPTFIFLSLKKICPPLLFLTTRAAFTSVPFKANSPRTINLWLPLLFFFLTPTNLT